MVLLRLLLQGFRRKGPAEKAVLRLKVGGTRPAGVQA